MNGADDQTKEQPGEFKLLVEEWRLIESLTGNENLEIQWRLATLSEAKAVVSHYHKHLSENGLIKSIPELSASSFSVKRELSYQSHQRQLRNGFAINLVGRSKTKRLGYRGYRSMRETVTVTMVDVLIGIVVVTLLVQFFCLEI